MKNPVFTKKIYATIAIVVMAAAMVSIWNVWEKDDYTTDQGAEHPETGVTIGGPFTLVDQTGKTVQDSDFRGHLMLVFFGFTRCPDICPISAATLSKTLDTLGDKASQVSVLFISIDPEHDTPASLKDFLANFNPHMLGLTGTPEQIKDVATEYKVYFAAQDPAKTSKPDEKKEWATHEGAEIDHSAFIYLMDKNGKYITHFSYDADPQEIADAISIRLQ